MDAKDRYLYAKFIHQRTLFRTLGFRSENVIALDVSPYEGAELIHDLNHPIDPNVTGCFDLVYDGGTIEHVFSIQMSLWNLVRLCKRGGIIINHTPADYINHGFVNVGIDLFRDFYMSNGFEHIGLDYVVVPLFSGRGNRYYIRFGPKDFRHPLHPFYGTTVFSSFQKIQETNLTIPTQGCYASVWSECTVGNNRPADRDSEHGKRFYSLVRHIVDSNFITSTLIRNYFAIRRGKRIYL